MVRFSLFLFLLTSLTATTVYSQLVAGPMLGVIELRDAKIWAEVSPSVSKAAIRVNKKGETVSRIINYKGELGKDFNPITFTVGGLEPNTTYEYVILTNDKATKASSEFTTKKSWK